MYDRLENGVFGRTRVDANVLLGKAILKRGVGRFYGCPKKRVHTKYSPPR